MIFGSAPERENTMKVGEVLGDQRGVKTIPDNPRIILGSIPEREDIIKIYENVGKSKRFEDHPGRSSDNPRTIP